MYDNVLKCMLIYLEIAVPCSIVLLIYQVLEKNALDKIHRDKWRRMKLAHRFGYRHSDDLRRSSTIRIANEFNEDIHKPQPLRKAVGLFSDEAAQELVR